jgi:hypothetical protein
MKLLPFHLPHRSSLVQNLRLETILPLLHILYDISQWHELDF